MNLEQLRNIDLNQIKIQLLEIGVDQKLIYFIEKMPTETQKGLFNIFLDIVEDELLFVLALTDMTLSDEYLLQKNTPSVAN